MQTEKTEETEKEFLDKYDIALVQKPYRNFVQSENYDKHRLGISGMAEIWTKTTVKATAVQRLTMDNYAMIRIEGPGSLYITSVYDEPGGVVNRRLEKLSPRMGNGLKRHIVAGGINAHCRSWGVEDTDRRGEELLAWITANGYRYSK